MSLAVSRVQKTNGDPALRRTIGVRQAECLFKAGLPPEERNTDWQNKGMPESECGTDGIILVPSIKASGIDDASKPWTRYHQLVVSEYPSDNEVVG